MKRTYFVECYWPGIDRTQLEETVGQLTGKRGVDAEARWLDSILIPDDEIVLSIFEGSSAGVLLAAAQAGLPADRIVECLRVTPDRSRERRDQRLPNDAKEA